MQLIGLPEFRVVEDVEEFGSALKAKIVGEAELTAQGTVPLRGAKAV